MINGKYFLGILVIVLGIAFIGCDNGSTNGNENENENIHVHQWGDWTQTKLQTYTEDGEETRVCVLDETHIETRSVSKFISTNIPGSSLSLKLLWLDTNATSDTTYLLDATESEELKPQILSYSGRRNITLVLLGIEGERTVSLESNGSLFTIEDGVTLILEKDITLKGRSSNDTSLIMVNEGGELVMNTGSKITSNKGGIYHYVGGMDTRFGAGVHVSGNFVMNGGEISNNTSIGTSHGGGVCVCGSFIMNGGIIKNNYLGGVYIIGSFIMNGGEISSNNANPGGGVFISGGSFIMNRGKIYNNSSSWLNSSGGEGGGVYLAGGTFTMHDGEIVGNKSTGNGAGIYNNGNFIMHGGVILDNIASQPGTSTPGVGGGVYNIGIFTMHNGEISGNSSIGDGSGVYVQDQTFTMYNGKISSNNSNRNGGGVYINQYGTFIMHNGEISGNGSNQNGGGVYAGGNFQIITGNIFGSGTNLEIRNTAASGAALFLSGDTSSVEHGIFNEDTWIKNGNLSTTNNTVRVLNGYLQ